MQSIDWMALSVLGRVIGRSGNGGGIVVEVEADISEKLLLGRERGRLGGVIN